MVQIKFDKPTSGDQIRRALGALELGEITVQDFGPKRENQFLIRFEKVRNIGSLGARIEGALNESYRSSNQAHVLRVETVGAKVGHDLRVHGFLAVAVATIFMGVYIAWQFARVSWSFGAGAVIALIHDVLVVSGALVLSRFEFDLTTLAALLTVIGYSVHDTIIVSDRIREDAAKRRREPLESIMNRAINETLSRTILTSGTALTVLASLLALGGPIRVWRLHLGSEERPRATHSSISAPRRRLCCSGNAVIGLRVLRRGRLERDCRGLRRRRPQAFPSKAPRLAYGV